MINTHMKQLTMTIRDGDGWKDVHAMAEVCSRCELPLTSPHIYDDGTEGCGFVCMCRFASEISEEIEKATRGIQSPEE